MKDRRAPSDLISESLRPTAARSARGSRRDHASEGVRRERDGGGALGVGPVEGDTFLCLSPDLEDAWWGRPRTLTVMRPGRDFPPLGSFEMARTQYP